MSLLSKLFKSHTKDIEASCDLVLYAPVTGHIISLSDVPDLIISEKIIGDGLAIIPENGRFYAPCDGEITRVISTNTAVAIRTDLGVEIYITFGVDSFEITNEASSAFVKIGDRVKKGDLLFDVDLEKVDDIVSSTASSMIVIEKTAKISAVNKGAGSCTAIETPCLFISLAK